MFTDRTVLTEAYADRGPLAARVSIYQWQQDRLDLASLVVDALVDVRGTVLDAGCGLGTYVERIQRARPDLGILALDLSAGMQPDVVGDVQALPLADASVGAALAMHMLYHVPDIPMAIRELRRVIRPGGVLVVSTNGVDDKRELGQLYVDGVRDLTGISIEVPDPDARFTPDDAPLLRLVFDSVQVEVFERETLVPDVEPVVAYIDSMRELHAGLLPEAVTWDAFLATVRRRVTAEIETSGSWHMRNQVGLLVCR